MPTKAIIFLFILSMSACWAQKTDASLVTDPDLRIALPANRGSVDAGTTITLTVETKHTPYAKVALIGNAPLGMLGLQERMPAHFTISIPEDTAPGDYTFTALGMTQDGKSSSSEPVTLKVEQPVLPVFLSANPSSLFTEALSGESQIAVTGTFADGRQVDLSESSHISYDTTDSAIVAAPSKGSLVPKAPGHATVKISYGVGGKELRINIPVVVSPGPIEISPNALSFGPQVLGGPSEAKSIKLENLTNGPVSIVKITSTPLFKETDDCKSNSALPAKGSCTVRVSFVPKQLGLNRGTLKIRNSFSGDQMLPLEGTAIDP